MNIFGESTKIIHSTGGKSLMISIIFCIFVLIYES